MNEALGGGPKAGLSGPKPTWALPGVTAASPGRSGEVKFLGYRISSRLLSTVQQNTIAV